MTPPQGERLIPTEMRTMNRPNAELPVRVEQLRKKFGSTTALDGFNLQVRPGEVHGFLGPNGAGKSTTIRALLGQLRPDSGWATIFGRDCWSESMAAHTHLAYVPGDVALWPGLSGGECIDILVRLQGGGSSKRRRELVERFDLDPTKRTRTYSKGNRQKVALVAALSKDCDLYLLDEPTSGLDPLMEEAFQQTVRELKRGGKSVLLSSHILSEVEALCDHVTIIRSGRAVASDSLDDLRARTMSWITVTTDTEIGGLNRLRTLKSLTVQPHPPGVRTRFEVGPDELVEALSLVMAGRVRRITVEPPSLNELFLAAYSGDDSKKALVT